MCCRSVIRRIAEEFARLDCQAPGRLLAGFVVVGPEYYSYALNPTFACEKFAEAHFRPSFFRAASPRLTFAQWDQ